MPDMTGMDRVFRSIEHNLDLLKKDFDLKRAGKKQPSFCTCGKIAVYYGKCELCNHRAEFHATFPDEAKLPAPESCERCAGLGFVVRQGDFDSADYPVPCRCVAPTLLDRAAAAFSSAAKWLRAHW